MLGRLVRDPQRLRGPAGDSPGLTCWIWKPRWRPTSSCAGVEGRLALEQARVTATEIHHGVTQGAALAQRRCILPNAVDGALSADGQILGTYLHGLFDDAARPATRCSAGRD